MKILTISLVLKFPQISINFSYFPQIFILILTLLVSHLPTRESPGYATAYIKT